MTLDLTTVNDHPATLLTHRYYDGNTQAAFHMAAAVLERHETEHNVTFAALDNDALAAVREAYDDLYPENDPPRAARAVADLVSALNSLLGLDS